MSERIKSLNSDIQNLNLVAEAVSKNPYKVYNDFLRLYEYDDEGIEVEVDLDGVQVVFSHEKDSSYIYLGTKGGMFGVNVSSDKVGYISELSYFKAIEAIIVEIFDEIGTKKKEIERLERANIPSLRPFEVELLDGKYKFPHFQVNCYKKNYGNLADHKDVMSLSLAAPQRHYVCKDLTAEQAQNIGQFYLNLLVEVREKQKLTLDELDTEIAKVTQLLKS